MASAIVVVALAVGSVIFVVLLRASLVDAESDATLAQAEQIARSAQRRIDIDPTGRDLLPPFDADEVIIQRQQDARVVEVADLDFAGTPPLPVSPGAAIAVVDGVRYVVRSAPLRVPAGPEQHVVVGRSIAVADDAAESSTVLLLVAAPATSVLVAALIWFVVGRSLRPVERIRRDVEAIGYDLSNRVDTPDRRDEVARLAATMNAMLSRLESSQRSQQRLVSDASHELRSPVATIRQHAQVALHHPQATDLGFLASVVDREAVRLLDLINDLLLLARIDEGAPREHTEIDVDDIVVAEVARLRDLGVDADTTGVGAARVVGDAGLLTRAVRNGGDNARRHARTRVSFSLVVVGDEAVLGIDDDGPGIPVQDRSRLFNRFERRDDARSRGDGGSGLGLAIIAEAARDCGGTAELKESTLGGARLEIRLPRASTG